MYRAASLRNIKYDLVHTGRYDGLMALNMPRLSVSVGRRRTDECMLSFGGAARGNPAPGVFDQHAVRAVVRPDATLRRPPQSGEGHGPTVSPHPATRTSRQT